MKPLFLRLGRKLRVIPATQLGNGLAVGVDKVGRTLFGRGPAALATDTTYQDEEQRPTLRTTSAAFGRFEHCDIR